MITLTFDMAWLGVVYSIILGTVGALFYSFIRILSLAFKRALRSKIGDCHACEYEFFIGGGVLEFIFFLSFGITYILLNYAACDGAFAAYSFLSLIASFALVNSFILDLAKLARRRRSART